MERKCPNKDEIINEGGQVIENSDGTVTVFAYNSYTNNYYPKQLTLECCKTINPDYTFDVDNQECRWSDIKGGCDFSEPINLVINTKGDDGSLFFVDEEENETCTLDIKFDYLLKIKCEDLMAIKTPIKGLSQETINEINTLTVANEQIQTQIDSINSQIILLNSQLVDTPYSIECNSTSVLSEPITGFTQTANVTNFAKTGFGSKTADLVPDADEKIKLSTTKTIYCLTDYGLQAWETFLGPIRYQAFINGDPNSYTCKDVDKFVNARYRQPVVFDCKIPFGTRTEILIKLNDLGNQLTPLQTQLLDNQSQIKVLQTQLEDETSSCSTTIEAFESLDISMTLEVVNDDNSLSTVFESPLLSGVGIGNLYTYLTTNANSGFYVCGGESCNPMTLANAGNEDSGNEASCDNILDELINSLYSESGLNNYQTFLSTLPANAFSSHWLTFTTAVTDTAIIELIKNKKIKLNIKINSACGNFCILLDNISMNQNCSHVERTDIIISKNPGFDFKRVVDNKKSWVDETLSRQFLIESVKETNAIRQTNYNVNDERLVLNSKEIDLDINIATAIETDVWKYILDNPCLLTGETLCNPCYIAKDFQDDELFFFQDDNQYFFMDTSTGNTILNICCGDNLIEFDNLITSDISNLTTISDFTAVISGELIDAKNRQTISSYATLRALYDRYLNSIDYCNNSSSGFDYYSIDQFAGLIGDYWIDIIEQVIPSTTIWGSVKIYTNTIFDEQKFKYKSYTSLACNNKFVGVNVLSPINGTSGQCENVEVITTNVFNANSDVVPRQIRTTCDSICIAQMNYGSEFIGTVNSNDVIIVEPDPIDCLMSDWTPWTACFCGVQSRERKILIPANGGVPCGPTYEERPCTAATNTCWYNMQENPEYMMLIECDLAGWTSTTVSINSLIVNGTEYITTPLELYMDATNIDWIPANNNIISGCTLGGVTGWTYTNFVDFLNTTFSGFGLCDYSAEIALDSYALPGVKNKNGLYLTYPVGDDFAISFSSSTGVPSFDLTYTPNELLYEASGSNYYSMTCDLETYRRVNCELSEWSEFGPCDFDDMRTRTRTVITPAQNGGTECGPLIETVDCMLPTIKYCYEGFWDVDDPAHPSGGTVTYINELGLTVTESFIWNIDTVTIFAWDVISTDGVAPVTCNNIISISNDAEGEPDCHNSITVVVDTDTLVKVDIISDFNCGATYDIDLPLGFGVVGVYADLINDSTSTTKFYNYGINAFKTFTSGDTCTSSITINVKDAVDDGLLDTYTFYRIHNSGPHC